jgi:hypothetical protein
MKETDGTNNDAAAQNDSTTGGVGDVEAAGETTAAEMIGGTPDTRPVGLDSLANIKVSDTQNPSENNQD